jgi:RNA polymerase sigma factor (sigma-70 family)
MRQGDRRQRFDELYVEHHAALHAFFFARTGDVELAQDLLQELFVRAWRSIASVEALPAERRRFWLYSVARNLVVDAYRRRGAGQAAHERLQRLTLPGHVDAAEHLAVEGEAQAELDAAIRALPRDLREVLVLNVLGQNTSAEIGEIVGRPAGTVRYQLAQARRLLADTLRLEEPVS